MEIARLTRTILYRMRWNGAREAAAACKHAQREYNVLPMELGALQNLSASVRLLGITKRDSWIQPALSDVDTIRKSSSTSSKRLDWLMTGATN